MQKNIKIRWRWRSFQRFILIFILLLIFSKTLKCNMLYFHNQKHIKINHLNEISSNAINNITIEAQAEVQYLFEHLEKYVPITEKETSTEKAFNCLASFYTAKTKAKTISKSAQVIILVSKILTQGFTKAQIQEFLPTVNIEDTLLATFCHSKQNYICEAMKYRSFNGNCNNIQNYFWGNALSSFVDTLSKDYANGIDIPRTGQSDNLPNSRLIVSSIIKNKNQLHQDISQMIFQWGEFINHDISHIAMITDYKENCIKCCNVEYIHPECFSIYVSSNDSFYAKYNVTCIPYIRSIPIPKIKCALASRMQMNQVSSFIDASTIYGSSEEEAKQLRTFRGGKLKMNNLKNNDDILPSEENMFKNNTKRKNWFKSGDIRVNQHIGLIAIHTLWVREHNRVANNLARVNRHWNDEIIFQETRRIIWAEIQHISFNEFLPTVLGDIIMTKYDLHLQNVGYYNGYQHDVNPGATNEFAVAASKFIYSLLQDTSESYDKNYKLKEKHLLMKQIEKTSNYYSSGIISEYLRGLISQKAQNVDLYFTNHLTEHFYEEAKDSFGLDLISIIIQRGRDHGIPSYNMWKQHCGFTRAKNFQDLLESISINTVKLLESIYKHVDDIDLFIGGLAENPLRGGVVGPTFACIIGNQFSILKKGDRYWYENNFPPASFTSEQLDQLRRVTLARIICDNTNTQTIQPKVMLQVDSLMNARISCSNEIIRKIDFYSWIEENKPYVSETVLSRTSHEAKHEFHQREARQSIINDAFTPSNINLHATFLDTLEEAEKIENPSNYLLSDSKMVLNQMTESGTYNSFRSDSSITLLNKKLRSIDLSEVLSLPLKSECDEMYTHCDITSKYRTITGWCNNLKNPEWAKSNRIFNRLLYPDYDDKINEPRQYCKSGIHLPSPRLISTTVHQNLSNPHKHYTHLLMQFGQFTDHDLTFTPLSTDMKGATLICKDCDSYNTISHSCFPIFVPENDHYFKAYDTKKNKRNCIPFTRSSPGKLGLGPREQLNQVTSYLDASQIYGSDLCVSKKLRSFKGGKMKISKADGGLKDFLPLSEPDQRCVSREEKPCFMAGDRRSNENPGLSCLHNLWLRHHNQIANSLEYYNHHWSDDKIYQETRKIIGAHLQRIVFHEFLPRILGWEVMNKYGLHLEKNGYYKEYEPHCDGTLLNEFAAAAFRFGHSLIRPHYVRLDKNYKQTYSPLILNQQFMNPDGLYSKDGGIDSIMRGLLGISAESFDPMVTSQVTDHLFETLGETASGMDLVSLNIQRGRDHGLPSYNVYRKLFNMTKAKSFHDFSDVIINDNIEKLKKVYDHPDDVDLFSGGLSESSVHGGLVGPTFAHIIANVFHRVRKCDRFWHETHDPLIRFSEGQLAEIRKFSLAKLICSNADGIHEIQKHAFDMADDYRNPRVPCEHLPDTDISLWKEHGQCHIGDETIQIGHSAHSSPCKYCRCTKEGLYCQSLRVKDCANLMMKYSKEAILEDNVCKVQCAATLYKMSESDY